MVLCKFLKPIQVPLCSPKQVPRAESDFILYQSLHNIYMELGLMVSSHVYLSVRMKGSHDYGTILEADSAKTNKKQQLIPGIFRLSSTIDSFS